MRPNDHSIFYQIRVAGHINKGWFKDLTVTLCSEGETIISGLMDQSALHGILHRIRDLGLALLSIQSYSNEKEVLHE